ncbi:hypothetical protein K3495_g15169 [Podosphaera aphanis]|nr:hypothetical protein K3495_g15169 [Podosphaera aphanis]
MKPLVIFKGKNLSSGWFPATSTPDWAYCSSPYAWTSNDIALKWLEQVFIPSTSTEGYRLLLLDGHKSHATHEFMWKCYTTKYRAKIAELSRFDDASDVKKQTFIKLYSKASYESLKTACIKNGWMAAGIQPWNPVKAAQSRFVLKTPCSVQIQPPTPPNRKCRLSETELITTPCIPRQFRDLFRSAQNGGSSSRTRRLLFQKAYKGIDKISFQLQLEKEKNDSKDIQLEQLKRKDHRGVIIDANKTFARLEQVHQAKEAESARDDAERARIAHFEANFPVASSVGSSLQDHCFEFSPRTLRTAF